MAHQTETHARPPSADRPARPRDRDGDGDWDEELVPDERGRTEAPEADCPVEVALAAIAGRWTTLILRELMHGPHSFGDLRDRLPSISPKVLAERLRVLGERELLVQDRLLGFPVRTRYHLTPAGRALRPLLVELYSTGANVQALRARRADEATELPAGSSGSRPVARSRPGPP
ncbi:winged helix-turn-helix transcriptional regulator [Streptomyces sp. NPDC059578]|uniref:winged helix-turn-helix transcriptional regulator n=1 Tax=Streptomyces sp. NPDC059578 TaxID=3346874 RepID=UPI00368CD325